MSLDLNKLETKLDEALSNETSESLNEFLNDKRMSNNKQQTPVEWLEQQIKLRGITHYFSIRELIEQAKEMEKEQKNNMPIHIEEGVSNTHVYIENGVIHVKANKETYRNNHAVMIGGDDHEP